MLDFQILRGYDIAGEHRCLSKVFYPIKIEKTEIPFQFPNSRRNENRFEFVLERKNWEI